MSEALDPNLCGLIHVLAGVLVREVNREVREQFEQTEPVDQVGDNQTESALTSHASAEDNQAT